MDWEAFTPYRALIGGALIGLATGLVLLLNGKIAGISGVIARALRPTPGDRAWRLWFLAGLIGGGALVFLLLPSTQTPGLLASTPVMAIAGLLVGLGTRLGGGCTSGHGVCGISRGSLPGIVATLTFMLVAGIVVYVQRIGA